MTRFLRAGLAALLTTLAAGPLASAQPPKPPQEGAAEPGKPIKPADAKKIKELEDRITELKGDLAFVQKKVEQPAERDRQESFIKQQIADLEARIQTLSGKVLKDLVGTGPLKQVDEAVRKATQRSLSEEELKLYLKTKEAVLKRLSPAVALALKRDSGFADEDQPLAVDTVPDDKFIKLLRLYYDRYYGPTQANRGQFESLGYYESNGKKIDAPGLRVLKAKKYVYADDSDTSRKEVYEYEYPSNTGPSAPELWPILFDKSK